MPPNPSTPTARELVELERAALTRWCKGDPSGFLELSAPNVVYFDPFIPQRLDGLEALSRYYESIRGKVSAERFELLNPVVQCVGELAVLTFNFVSYGANGTTLRWNCTEAYQQSEGRWRIIHTHWSFTAPSC